MIPIYLDATSFPSGTRTETCMVGNFGPRITVSREIEIKFMPQLRESVKNMNHVPTVPVEAPLLGGMAEILILN